MSFADNMCALGEARWGVAAILIAIAVGLAVFLVRRQVNDRDRDTTATQWGQA